MFPYMGAVTSTEQMNESMTLLIGCIIAVKDFSLPHGPIIETKLKRNTKVLQYQILEY